MWPTETMHSELRRYRLSRTRQRAEVYYAVGRLGPVSRVGAAVALEEVVSRATVFRTIKAFLATQVIRELPGGLVELGATFKHERYSILCRSCGSRTYFWDPKLEDQLNLILEQWRFVLPVQQVELSGLCELCAYQI